MDLGFGDSNQIIGNAAAKVILQAHKQQEEAITDEINRYDALLNIKDDEVLEALREKRLSQMRQSRDKKEKWRSLGHGTYSALGEGQHGADIARAFFEAAKRSERLVVHFHRKTTRSCDVFHAHLESLAREHVETRFVKIDVGAAEEGGGGSGSAYLVEKMGIRVMPTLLIVKDRKAVHQMRGFDELGGVEDFSGAVLAYVLGCHGAIYKRDDEQVPEELEGASRQRGGLNSIRVERGRRGNAAWEDFDSD